MGSPAGRLPASLQTTDLPVRAGTRTRKPITAEPGDKCPYPIPHSCNIATCAWSYWGHYLRVMYVAHERAERIQPRCGAYRPGPVPRAAEVRSEAGMDGESAHEDRRHSPEQAASRDRPAEQPESPGLPAQHGESSTRPDLPPPDGAPPPGPSSQAGTPQGSPPPGPQPSPPPPWLSPLGSSGPPGPGFASLAAGSRQVRGPASDLRESWFRRALRWLRGRRAGGA